MKNGMNKLEQLTQLAEHPLDLTEEGNLTPERIKKYIARGCGYTLSYATERVTDDVLEALQQLADQTKAVEKLRGQFAGEHVNKIEGYPSEDRPVLHTAMRDQFGSPIGDQEAAAKQKKELEKLRTFLEKIDGKFSDMVVIGIGGSNLGQESVYIALEKFLLPGRQAHFVSNIDPDNMTLVLKNLDLSRTLVSVVSKSGSTLETVTNETFARQQFEEAGLNPKEHFVSVSMAGGPMDDTRRYLECFYSWPYVGGRFSTSGMYGAVTLGFAFGFDALMEFLKGAHEMDHHALNPNMHDNLPLMVALLGIWNRNFLNHQHLAVVAYAQVLRRFVAHIQQVDMESNGKHITSEGEQASFETGPIVFGEPGTNAQHSFYQLLHQGTTIVPMEVIGFKNCQFGQDIDVNGSTNQEKLISNMIAQSIAMAQGKASPDNPNKEFQGNRPSHILFAEEVNPKTLGALFALYEHKIALQGYIWGINSFDQNGVELGKVLANKVIDSFAGGTKYPLGDAFIASLGIK